MQDIGVRPGDYILRYDHFGSWELPFSIQEGEIKELNLTIPFSNTTFQAYLDTGTTTYPVDATFNFYYQGNNTYESTENYIELPALDYTVNVSYQDFYTYAEDVTLLQGSDLAKNIYLPATDLTLSLFDPQTNNFVPNATITVQTASGDDTGITLTTDDSGFVTTILPQQNYLLTIQTGGSTFTQELTLDQYSQNVQVDIPTGIFDFTTVLAATVYDAIPHAQVEIEGVGTFTSGDTGDLTLELPRGPYTFTVTDPRWEKSYTFTRELYLGQDEVYLPIPASILSLSLLVNLTYPGQSGATYVPGNSTVVIGSQEIQTDADASATVMLPKGVYDTLVVYRRLDTYKTELNITGSAPSHQIVIDDHIAPIVTSFDYPIFEGDTVTITASTESSRALTEATLYVTYQDVTDAYSFTITDNQAELTLPQTFAMPGILNLTTVISTTTNTRKKVVLATVLPIVPVNVTVNVIYDALYEYIYVEDGSISALENGRLKVGRNRAIALGEAFGVHPATIMFADYEPKIKSRREVA